MKNSFSKNILLILILLSVSNNVFARLKTAEKYYHNTKLKDRDLKIFKELYKSKYYFSSFPYAAQHILKTQKIDKKFETKLENLILKTGTIGFLGINSPTLKRHNSPSLSFILGIKKFRKKSYKSSFIALKKVNDQHRFAPEARFIQGAALDLLGKVKLATKYYKRCILVSSTMGNMGKHEKLRRYYKIIEESCQIHIARMQFKKKKYEDAIVQFDKIAKTSYKWPFLLIEKAWSKYHLKDYNRSLGLLVTYKSPLLTSYFFPEAEVLAALSYHRMCLWKDANSTIEQFYKVYKPRSNSLKKILLENKNSSNYFLKLMFAPISESEKKNPFIRNLITQIRKKVKFSLDLISYKKAQKELKFLKTRKQTPFIKKLIKDVSFSVSWRGQNLNHFIKKHMFSFINKIHRYSYELFNIKLEIMSKQRDLIYKSDNLISNRLRGDFKNIKLGDKQQFWKFKGDFWADELGDYSFGLKSNCETLTQGEKK